MRFLRSLSSAAAASSSMVLLVSVVILAACTSVSGVDRQAPGRDGRLPDRVRPPDTSRVTAALRANGGPAFVHLTALPTPQAVLELEQAGLRGPYGLAHPVTYDSLRVNFVWGFVPRDGVDRIAAVRFVTCIEPSSDPDGIFPQRGELRDRC